MNTKQRKILQSIFTKPTLSTIEWKELEGLIITLGGKIKKGKGSADAFILKQKIFPFHKPHPQKEAKRYQIDDLRKFLLEMEIKP